MYIVVSEAYKILPFVRNCIELHCFDCVALYCIVLYVCIALHSVVLYVLHCAPPPPPQWYVTYSDSPQTCTVSSIKWPIPGNSFV